MFLLTEGGPNKNTSGSSGGGGKKGKEWWQDEENKRLLIMTGSGLLAMYFLSMGSGASLREINWQDFRINYLERGEVDHVVISNKSLAKVYLKSDPANVSLLNNVYIMIFFF